MAEQMKTEQMKMVRLRRRIDEAYFSDFVHVTHKGELTKSIPEAEANRMMHDFPGEWELLKEGQIAAEMETMKKAASILSAPVGNGIAVMEFKGDKYFGDAVRMSGPGKTRVSEKEGRRLAHDFPEEWKLLEIIKDTTPSETGTPKPPAKGSEKKMEGKLAPTLDIDDKTINRGKGGKRDRR